MWRRNSLAKGLLLAVLSLAVSCKTSDDAVALAAQMTAAANSLCDYYAALAQIVDNHAKLERLQSATTGVPFEQQDMAQLQAVQGDLQKRADMARGLANLAAAFTGLSGSTAPSDVSNSAANLGNELATIPQIPGSAYTPTALQEAGKILTQFAQERDERKMAKSIEPTMTALSQMFSHEKPVYESINRTYIGLAQSIALDMVTHNQVDPASLMAPSLQPFGLASRIPTEQLSTGLADYAREQIKNRAAADIAAQAQASDAVDGALRELSKRSHQLATDGHMLERGLPFTLSDVDSWIKLIG